MITLVVTGSARMTAAMAIAATGLRLTRHRRLGRRDQLNGFPPN